MYQIKWTSEAEERYLDILQFWINHNKSAIYSEKIINEVEHKELLLSQNPWIGILIEDTNQEVRRVLVLDNFSLFYRIIDNTIEIVSFWANKMNPDDLRLL